MAWLIPETHHNNVLVLDITVQWLSQAFVIAAAKAKKIGSLPRMRSVSFSCRMPLSKQWVFSGAADCSGTFCENLFEMVEEHTSDLSKGEILCRALFLSVDPITRLYLHYGVSSGETIPGRQVARVVESRHKNFPKGKVS